MAPGYESVYEAALQQGGMLPKAQFMPTILEATDEGNVAMDAISRLFQSRIIMVSGPVTDTMADVLTAQLHVLKSQTLEKSELDDEGHPVNPQPIKLFINSPGGSITAMNAILDAMDEVKESGIPIATYCKGLAASAASLILSNGTPGMRFVTPRSKVMIHQPLIMGGVGGQTSDIEIITRELQRDKAALIEHLVQTTYGKKTSAQVKKDIERDTYLHGQEAVDYGIVDAVASK